MWARPIESVDDLPVLEFTRPVESEDAREALPGEGVGSKAREGIVLDGFEAVDVELSWLNISDRVRNAIITGEGVADRSADSHAGGDGTRIGSAFHKMKFYRY